MSASLVVLLPVILLAIVTLLCFVGCGFSGQATGLSPFTKFAAVPLGFLIKRTLSPRLKVLGSLVKWGPLVFGAMRGVASAFKSRDSGARF